MICADPPPPYYGIFHNFFLFFLNLPFLNLEFQITFTIKSPKTNGEFSIFIKEKSNQEDSRFVSLI